MAFGNPKSFTTTAFAHVTSMVMNKPSDVNDGNLLISIFVSHYDDEPIDSVPSGWTALTERNGAFGRMWAYYKIASSEPASWTWGFDDTVNNRPEAGCVLAFEGQSIADPFGPTITQQVSNSSNPSFSSTDITPDIANSVLIFVLISRDGSANHSNYAIATSNPTWTKQFELDSGSEGAFSVATAPRPQSTGTGNWSASTNSSSHDSMMMGILVNPQTDTTFSGAVGSLVLNGNSGAQTGSSNTAGSVGILSLSGNAGDPEIAVPDWRNADLSADPNWNNPDLT